MSKDEIRTTIDNEAEEVLRQIGRNMSRLIRQAALVFGNDDAVGLAFAAFLVSLEMLEVKERESTVLKAQYFLEQYRLPEQ